MIGTKEETAGGRLVVELMKALAASDVTAEMVWDAFRKLSPDDQAAVEPKLKQFDRRELKRRITQHTELPEPSSPGPAPRMWTFPAVRERIADTVKRLLLMEGVRD